MNVRVTIPGQSHEHVLELRVENYRRGRPPILSGPPDNWAPSEGTEFDVLSAWLIHGKKYRLLPRLLREQIVDDNEGAIAEALDMHRY